MMLCCWRPRSRQSDMPEGGTVRQHDAYDPYDHRHGNGRRRISALVHSDARLESEQRAIVGDRRVDFDVLLAGVSGCHQVLVAVLDPFDGTTQFSACRADCCVLTEDVAFEAKGSAYISPNDAQTVGRLIQDAGQHEAIRVRRLS